MLRLATRVPAWRCGPSRASLKQLMPVAVHVRQQSTSCKKSCHATPPGTAEQAEPAAISPPPPLTTLAFWSSRSAWRRAGVNTFRCLVGCTTGDFAAMWYLQAFHPDVGMSSIMAISMASGLTTSMLLETALLHWGRDRLPWPAAARTAAGMSLISMLTMEAAQNAVDWHLTGGVVALDSPVFWLAAAVSMAAGYLAPLPYNYFNLRRFGKACH
ncbi:uncharacterized protein E0L32_002961 [Thyridium curvatum]|uniref:DUF4396 domain-containing protein n=1 Tax=Thyridium curvatum TaxID=1093900 RepID=A0A507BMA9_9PEZI|nr:uncharacterized protein E0L32_002961 [Thyridium curvatum]TPX17860.1 hypothetical protein E0L32_002961 [Thyridium curvatum]